MGACLGLTRTRPSWSLHRLTDPSGSFETLDLKEPLIDSWLGPTLESKGLIALPRRLPCRAVPMWLFSKCPKCPNAKSARLLYREPSLFLGYILHTALQESAWKFSSLVRWLSFGFNASMLLLLRVYRTGRQRNQGIGVPPSMVEGRPLKGKKIQNSGNPKANGLPPTTALY